MTYLRFSKVEENRANSGGESSGQVKIEQGENRHNQEEKLISLMWSRRYGVLHHSGTILFNEFVQHDTLQRC